MKRRLELNEIHDNGNSFFKRPKSEGPISKLLEIALSYKGKLNHISTSGDYLSFKCMGFKEVANEFILHFCDEIGTIPTVIKEEVLNKFQQRKIKETEFHLCCWEFCCLVFHDIGLISKEQINELCYIVFKSNEHTEDTALTLGDAFHKEDLNSYQKHTPETLPSPGDLLLFIRDNSDTGPDRVCHMAICINDKGGFIELESDCVSVNNLKNFYQDEQKILEAEARIIAWNKAKSDYESESDAESDTENKTAFDLISVYYVPFNEIQQNIQNFRTTHQNWLDLKITGKKNEMDVLKDLEKTQYAELVQNCLLVDDFIESINQGPCSLPLWR